MNGPGRLLLAVAGLSAGSLGAQVKGGPLESLVRDSPFIPAGGMAARPAASAAGPLELRGVVFENGSYSFSIYDGATHEAIWVKLEESGHDFIARSFNRERDELVVEHQGRSLTLPLQEAKTTNTADAGGAPMPPPGATAAVQRPANPAPAQPAAASPAPTAAPPSQVLEAQRLQDLADEVRRRRNVGSPPPGSSQH